MKIERLIIDTNKTLGKLVYLRSKSRELYENGVKTNRFAYDIVLLSDKLKGEVVISKFPKDLDLPYMTEIELIGEVEVKSTVAGAGEYRTIAHTLVVEDIKVKGNVSHQKEDKK
ncbi:hypothetical protein HZY83_05430 [Gemella sp. GH3]|uniref:hypothetical protein n=1 Tax=unclassified Gemella TaxID=2624949 RepID=UPI0015D02084|nr:MULTISPECIES: hypothetical protein [unclassified Gemella]MBF0714113.1 hypothetical protein [Gemella sp. GH3.1]NYS51065.1 hypothetical protein [Gemella sp. GH3]